MAWAKEEAELETLKYKEERKSKAIQITFHADRQLDFDKQKFFRGGYLFLQSIYYDFIHLSNSRCYKTKNTPGVIRQKTVNILSELKYNIP
jgi:hypothetical protein